MSDVSTIDVLREIAMTKLVEFRAALIAYKKEAKQPPFFLHEKRPVKIRDDALKNCRVFTDRFQMMRAMATGDVGAEVGVQHGDFSRFLLDTFDLKRLHLLDLSIPQIRPDVRNDARVSLHGGDSSSNLAKLDPGSLDWAYIDGDHSYRGAMKDARAAQNAVKPGGILFFNDYTMWSPGEAIPYGVVAVVNELVNEGHEMIAIALTPNGYFDVALRR